MIRDVGCLSSPIFFPGCESQEWSIKYLKNNEKKRFEILFFWPCANLRNCSILGEQNALCHGFRGSQTESPANRPPRAGTGPQTRDTISTSGFATSSSSFCHGAG